MTVFKKLSLVNQAALPQVCLVLVFFVAFAVVAYHHSKNALIAQAEESLQRDTRLVVENLAFYEGTLRDNANRLSQAFFAMLDGEIEIDPGRTLDINGYDSPVLLHESRPLNLDFSFPDQFTRLTGGTATVFVRYEDDFLRATTSLRKTDGTRAIGTLLGKTHPGYQKLMDGERYVGRAHLFGRDYMTVYAPVLDARGEVIAILYVGFDFTAGLESLYRQLEQVRFGESGGVLVYSTKEGKGFGKTLVDYHGDSENVSNMTDADGNALFVDMHRNHHGSVSYSWYDSNGNGVREMIASYRHSPEWDMMVVSRGYVDELASASGRLRDILILAGAFCSVVLLALTMFLFRHGFKPLQRIAEIISEISEGNLQQEVASSSKQETSNELEWLKTDINQLLTNLNALVKKIINSSSSIDTSIGSLAGIADKNLANVSTQQREADSLASAITEMVASSQEIASFTQNAASETQGVNELVDEGQEIVSASAKTAHELADTINQTAELVDRVNQDSMSISTVLDVIRDIAEQTNLLALNAAIEAARAGEQGRGFAVVADEVRTLAQRSHDSTHKIQSIIENLQSGAGAAVNILKDGITQSEESVEEANQAAQALEAINLSMDKLEAMTSEIANAARNQQLAGENIDQSIVSIADAASESSDSCAVLKSATGELRELSQSLQSEVNNFKIRA